MWNQIDELRRGLHIEGSGRRDGRISSSHILRRRGADGNMWVWF